MQSEKTVNNLDIRKAIHDNGLVFWQVAAAAGISETTLIRWLRLPVTEKQRETITAAIDEACRRNGQGVS